MSFRFKMGNVRFINKRALFVKLLMLCGNNIVKKRKLAILILILIFLTVVLFFSCRKAIICWRTLDKAIIHLTTIETAENIKSINEVPDWLPNLPTSAKHISYWRMPWTCTAFEYEVNEIDFLQWAKKNEIPLTEINAVSEIHRYLSYPDTDDPNELSEYHSTKRAIVYQGYEYHWVQENGGGRGSHIVYDSKNQKAYHYYPNR